MKKRMKNIVSMILALALILSVIPLFPGQASAAELKYTEEQYEEVYLRIFATTGMGFLKHEVCLRDYPEYYDHYVGLLNEAVETGDVSKCVAFYNDLMSGKLEVGYTEAQYQEIYPKIEAAGSWPYYRQDCKEYAPEFYDEYVKALDKAIETGDVSDACAVSDRIRAFLQAQVDEREAAAEQARLDAMYDPAKIDTSGVGFTDVKPGAWYYEAVTTMAATGILKGKTPELFKPNDKITVGEWCTIVWRLVGSELYAPEDAHYIGYDHWASSAVGDCWQYDYTSMAISRNGSNESSLANRGEVATAIVKIVETAYGKEDPDLVGGGAGKVIGLAHKEQDGLAGYLLARQEQNGAKTWTGDMIPDWAVIEKNVEPKDLWGVAVWSNTHRWDPDSIVRAYNYGILEGKDASGTCHPEMNITRAEACQMLYNALIFESRPILVRGGGFISG